MKNPSRGAYRLSIRPDPKEPTRYVWTIAGTQALFHEESATSYATVEQALSEGHVRLGQLT